MAKTDHHGVYNFIYENPLWNGPRELCEID